MGISREQVRKTGELAKLSLAEAELDRLATQLQEFLDYVNVLAAMPAGSTILEVADSGVKLSEREKISCLSQAQVVALAPDTWQGLVRVPRVIEYE
ncbi:MAG: Asp-tRNA(Asn)/Glu-tRNA(Gln) amidotransferase subunit GatC [Eubacteriales bacterium]|nr:Asp-tRNA(Asn)/Glu-tRNA(Gln) amidotransferase subunit GatC [Eubacteriales bacterium]MDD4769460.1 Asp-tRNA(Asn)/Glu-tRNA(Gln) amidotransferase subunit GatC [Eubacteriales bacterium]